MKKLLFCIAAMLLSFTGGAQGLRIAVAANAQFVARTLAAEFKRETGLDAELVVGASGKFTTQIEQGAPFDVFLSADMKYPQELFEKGFTTGKPRVYAYGKLVIWTLKNISIRDGLYSLTALHGGKIAIANPELAPYGEAAIQALTRLKLLEKVQPNVVYGESIAQVNQYLLTGAADVALTAKSVVLDPGQAGKGKWAEVPGNLYTPIAQGVVILRPAAANPRAQRFYQFIFSKPAQEIFRKYGYQQAQ